jgi:hypothetical protein
MAPKVPYPGQMSRRPMVIPVAVPAAQACLSGLPEGSQGMSLGEAADGEADSVAGGQAGEATSGGAGGRWAGGARMLSGLRWDPVSVQAVLEIAPGRIELRPRSRFMQRLRLIDEISVVPGNEVVIYPGRQTAPHRFQRERYGIAI